MKKFCYDTTIHFETKINVRNRYYTGIVFLCNTLKMIISRLINSVERQLIYCFFDTVFFNS